MSYYIYSTLTNDQNYVDYERPSDKNMLPLVKSKIFIKGGTGVSNKHFITPRGTVTQVSDEEYSILEKNLEFQKHVKGGHIKAEKRAYAPEKVASDMESSDKSAPLTPENYGKRIPVLPGTEAIETPKAVVAKSKKAA